MVRVVQSQGPIAAFSPDGSRFVTLVWHGDLERNKNIYDLLLFDVLKDGVRFHDPRRVLRMEYGADSMDQHAAAITDIRLLPDNRTAVFINHVGEGPSQVYQLDLRTQRLKQLTNHPSDVTSYALGPEGELKVYSAKVVTPTDSARRSRVRHDAVFLSDPSVFAFPPKGYNIGAWTLYDAAEQDPTLEYFLLRDREGSEVPVKLFDTRSMRSPPQSSLSDNPPKPTDTALVGTAADVENAFLYHSPTFIGSPSGRYAVIWPYSFADRERYLALYGASPLARAPGFSRLAAVAYGLMDLETGKITRLVDAPRDVSGRGGGEPTWSPDGRSLVIHSMLPLEGDSGTRKARSAEPAQWIEVDIATRRVARLKVPEEWRVVRWNRGAGNTLVLTNEDGMLASIRKRTDGSWEDLREEGKPTGLNPKYEVATNGAVVIGVRDSLLTPPEITAYRLRTKQQTILTDLNPRLRNRLYGQTSVIHWSGKYDTTSFGYLIKPVNHVAGKGYPLVVIWTGEANRPDDRSFILDGMGQLSGYAVQTLAAAGIMVLLSPAAPSIRATAETPKELLVQQEQIESAIAYLVRSGLADSTRVALSGWSRDAFHTDAILINSKFRFAAASKIDGGNVHYIEGGRPWRTEELARIRTPYLMEAHGHAGAVFYGPMYDAMRALGKPVEFLSIRSAPHATTLPLHRWRSLNAHTDWFRFWLQGYEDPDPAKRAMYARWRRLREK